MNIIAVDPGTTESGVVILRGDAILDKMKMENNRVTEMLIGSYPEKNILVYEMIASYGMAVGVSIFETCLWTGRFIQAFKGKNHRIYRREVKHHLCNSHKAKDANVRQALLDKYPATGGGKTPQIGTKKQPGPLFGFSGDMWAALGVAITFKETKIGTL